MKNSGTNRGNILFGILALVVLASSNFADDKALVSENALRLESFITSWIIIVDEENKRECIFSAYIENVGLSAQRIALGKKIILDVAASNPVVVRLSPRGDEKGKIVRLPDHYYNIVTLNPGEKTLVHERRWVTDLDQILNLDTFVYSVDPEFGEFYNVWIGDLITHIVHIE